MLLEYEADVNLCTKYQKTAIMLALRHCDLYIVKLLLDYGANLNV